MDSSDRSCLAHRIWRVHWLCSNLISWLTKSRAGFRWQVNVIPHLRLLSQERVRLYRYTMLNINSFIDLQHYTTILNQFTKLFWSRQPFHRLPRRHRERRQIKIAQAHAMNAVLCSCRCCSVHGQERACALSGRTRPEMTGWHSLSPSQHWEDR